MRSFLYNYLSMKLLKVGSRGSALALRQTQMVMDEITHLNPGVECRVQIIKTTGDKILDVPLANIGDKGLFVKEIEAALLGGEIDLAVHSAKDLPTGITEKLAIAAYPERECPADALISKCGGLNELPAGARVGTSSLRRRAQLLAERPDLEIIDLRGNLDTRLRKLDGGEYDAIVLAVAGLARMGLESRITEVLPCSVCIPAAGQGALAIQCRAGDAAYEIAAALDSYWTRACVIAERALLERLEGGCQVPIAALAVEDDGRVRLEAAVAALDGASVERKTAYGTADSPEELGFGLAEALLMSPARELLEAARTSAERNDIGAD